MSRRGATGLAGVLVVDKPSGMTSHDVVAFVRRSTGERRVGHAGTLDPAATGVLVVLIGPYTRLAPYLSGRDKTYRATIAFGSETDTDDADGRAVRTAAVRADLFDPSRARAVLAEFLGPSEQVPPAFSAIKVGGRAAHRIARAGKPTDLPARPIVVHRAELLTTDAAARTWDVELVVSKGTYVRALARDIGRRAGTAAHLASLRRRASGALTLEHAHTLDEVEAAAQQGSLTALFADPVAALELPSVEAPPAHVLAGRALPAELAPADRVAITAQGRLIALYARRGTMLVPEAVFPVTGVA